ncbi:MAG: hypothetical protein Q4B15_02180 [Lachnospiraceae bacterium]|nr:hypothetical protein [Lachnospiraceae bacterium]
MGRAEERARRRRREQKKRARRKQIRRTLIILLLIAAATAIVIAMVQGRKKRQQERLAKEAEIAAEEQALADKRALISAADQLAAGYDYDGAIELLQSQSDYDIDMDLTNAIAEYTASRTNMEAKDTTSVSHLCFGSMISDTSRAFSSVLSPETLNSINATGTTVAEFNTILQNMYDNGYVLVRMEDLITVTEDEEGNRVLSKNTALMMPLDKKPYVISVNDWSCPIAQDGMGLTGRAVVDDDGTIRSAVSYDADAETGAYDFVSCLNAFMEEHPDGAYRGARGTLGISGSEGVLGYRTASAYETGEGLTSTQQSWLDAHPDYDRNEEIAAATAAASAIRESGWTFAYRSYNNASIGYNDIETAREDFALWQSEVEPIVGEVNTMIFVDGSDIGDWHLYDKEEDEVFAYYKDAGIDFYLTVDVSSEYWIQLTDDYLRMGRIPCNGYQMWNVISGDSDYNVFENFFDVTSVFDSERRTPINAV